MGERPRVGGGPGEHRLAPVHPHDVVDGAAGDELPLGRVPERLVGLGTLELVEGVDRLALVADVLPHRRVDPRRERVQRGEARVPRAEVERELAPGKELVEELLDRLARALGNGSARDFGGAHLAEVEIRREAARAVCVGGLRATRFVVDERGGAEGAETRERGGATADDARHAGHGVVDLAGGDFGDHVGARQVEGVELEAIEQRGGELHLGRAIAHGFERMVADLEQLGANRARRPLFLLEGGGGNEAMRVDRDDAHGHAIGESERPLGDPRGREGVGDDHHRPFGQPVHLPPVIVAPTPQPEAIRQPQARCACGEFAGVLEDEGLEPVVRMFVGGIEPLVDEEGPREPVGFEGGEPERPVLLEAMRSLHPVQHIRPGRALGGAVQGGGPKGQLVGDKRGVEAVHRVVRTAVARIAFHWAGRCASA